MHAILILTLRRLIFFKLHSQKVLADCGSCFVQLLLSTAGDHYVRNSSANRFAEAKPIPLLPPVLPQLFLRACPFEDLLDDLRKQVQEIRHSVTRGMWRARSGTKEQSRNAP